jgi:hypothetical protein
LITGGTQKRRNGIIDQRRMKTKTLQVKQPTEQICNWHINKAMQYYQEANQTNDHQEEQQEEGDNESYKSTTSKVSS